MQRAVLNGESGEIEMVDMADDEVAELEAAVRDDAEIAARIEDERGEILRDVKAIKDPALRRLLARQHGVTLD